MTTALHAKIRFLAIEGSVSPNLAKATPPVRQWRHTTLPKHFSSEQLEHVDWAEGVIHVCLGKARRERILPLPEEVGAALVDYLRRERPPSSDRTIFLRSCPHYKPLRTVFKPVKQVLRRAGISGSGVGAHHFRHTVATHMVRQGVPFKDVADILGHRKLDTTAIYAKLDLPSLDGVALPWPGGAQ